MESCQNSKHDTGTFGFTTLRTEKGDTYASRTTITEGSKMWSSLTAQSSVETLPSVEAER